MEMALYDPELGYYRQNWKDPVGRAGDFVTAPTLGRGFAGLLAWSLGRWLLDFGGNSWHLAEFGAHDGRLARDLIPALARWFPDSPRHVVYHMVEAHARHHSIAETLVESMRYLGWEVELVWSSSVEELPDPFSGILFSNEFLDAFPVHQYRWDRGRGGWVEMGVAVEKGQIVWCSASEVTVNPFSHPLAQAEEAVRWMPDGFLAEDCPGAREWWTRAASRLHRGLLGTVDYGWISEERWRPERAAGTLRAYREHAHLQDFLGLPGQCDLTCHVDFSELIDVGERLGLDVVEHYSQDRLLGRWLADLVGRNPDGARRWFQEVGNPSHWARGDWMGGSFRGLFMERKS